MCDITFNHAIEYKDIECGGSYLICNDTIIIHIMFMRNIRHSLIQHERQSHKKSEMNHENQIFFQILRPLYYIQVAIGK